MTSSRRTTIAGIAVLSLAGAILTSQSALAATTHATPQASTWSATKTQPVGFSGPQVGALSPSKQLQLSIALTPRNAAAMTTAIKALYNPKSATYHQYLTPSQWAATYAPTSAQAAKVTSYLQSQGFKSVTLSSNRMLVTATATAAQAEAAFNTKLVNFTLGSQKVFGNTSAAQVPAALAGLVSAVIGLNNLPSQVTPLTAKTAAAGTPDLDDGLYPAQFDTTYDATGTTTGKSQSIAILTEGNTAGVISSLRYAEAQEGLPQVPVQVVNVGAQNPTDTSGADEFDMDSQVSTGVAGAVKKLYLYNIGSLLDPQIVADFEKFVSDDKAVAMSASIGGCEINSYLDGSELTTDIAMQQAAMQGQSLFASSGDNGDACMYVAALGAPAGVPGVNWPASGTFTTAVGGTSLISDADGNRVSEVAWVGSGGGVSLVENPGWWTADSDPATAAEYATGGRAVPDVALDADPNVATPAKVYVGNTISLVGGTSLSSPMMLGFWSRLEAAHSGKLGLASIPLYQVYDAVNPGVAVSDPVGLPVVVPTPNPAPVPGFTDITLGTNGIYPALPGYDLTTGLGAPDVKVLSKVIAPAAQ